MNDLAAFGAMLDLRHHGLEAGRDFSIVGCDDVKETAQWFPALTTVYNYQNEMGAKSAEFLLNRIADPAAPRQHLLLTPKLIVRHDLPAGLSALQPSLAGFALSAR